MKCPNCGNPEKARVRVCGQCGVAYASEDLLELRQLEYLLDETASWPEMGELRQPYSERLKSLKRRILPPEPLPAPIPAEAIRVEMQAPAPTEILSKPTAAPRAAEEKEAVPFDQWLLSERNIKFALYSGGTLLIIAGLIFVGVNWGRIPGAIKFVITLFITGLMYLGGYLLYKRPALRLGGIALLAVASGFFVLNFAVLQIYIFSERGLDARVMWLIASLAAFLLYVLITYWTRTDLFTYFSIAAFTSALTVGLALMEVKLTTYALAYSILAVVFWLGAIHLRSTRIAGYISLPLTLSSQVAAPLLFAIGIGLWLETTNCRNCPEGNPWTSLTALLTYVIFNIITDVKYHKIIARWVASFALALTIIFTLTELGLSEISTAIILMILALAYLLAGYALHVKIGRPNQGWPLYITGYALATFVTFQALMAYDMGSVKLAQVLIGDVILLAVSGAIHRKVGWYYAATWILIAPIVIYANSILHDAVGVGLVLGALVLVYTAWGYVLGRKSLLSGGAFLTPAAFLSVVVIVLLWKNPGISSAAVGIVALLYLWVAVWLGWRPLLFPALGAIHLLVISILNIIFSATSPWQLTLTVSYAAIGVALTLIGVGLGRTPYARWRWPIVVVATLDLTGTYLSGLIYSGWLAIGLGIAYALLSFWLAWSEQIAFSRFKLTHLPAYAGATLIFITNWYVIDLIHPNLGWYLWAPYAAGLCALMVAVSWLLRQETWMNLYGTPLHRAGLLFILLPLAGVVMLSSVDLVIAIFRPRIGPIVVIRPAIVAITFAIAGTIYIADAIIRRRWIFGYIGGGAYIVVLWTLLDILKVDEPQAYIFPLGICLILAGWNERRRLNREAYRWLTLCGLLLLMGSAFYQSLDASLYAALLLLESIAFFAWGVRTHSRGYVQFSILALLINAVAQLGPAFIELPRWVQIGVIGSILLGGGILGLYRRDQLITARKNFTVEWKKWQP